MTKQITATVLGIDGKPVTPYTDAFPAARIKITAATHSAIPGAITRIDCPIIEKGKLKSLSYYVSETMAGLVASSNLSGPDTNSQAFIDALVTAGISNSAINTASDTFIMGSKAAGLYSKYKAVYPFVGGTAAAHKLNMVDPRDLDAAFRLTFTAPVTHNANGITYAGGHADTHLNPNTVSPAAPLAWFNYVRGGNTTGLLLGADTGNFDSTALGLAPNGFGFSVYIPHEYNTGLLGMNTTNNRIRRYVDGVRILEEPGSFAGNGNFSFILGDKNNGGGYPSDANISFTVFCDPLTDDEVNTLNTLVKNFQTALGRAIPEKTFSYFFGDSQVYGYGLTDAERMSVKWTLLTSLSKGWVDANHGIGGTRFNNLDTNTIPTKRSNDAKLFFSYCTNDAIGDISVVEFKATMANAISVAVSKGWSLSDIWMVCSYYANATGLTTHLTRYNELRAGAAVQATASGINFIDPFTATNDAGITGDNVHLNNVGHPATAAYIIPIV